MRAATDGAIYIADYFGGNVNRYSASGTPLDLFVSTDLSRAHFMVLDALLKKLAAASRANPTRRSQTTYSLQATGRHGVVGPGRQDAEPGPRSLSLRGDQALVEHGSPQALATDTGEGSGALPFARTIEAHVRLYPALSECAAALRPATGGWKSATVLLHAYARWVEEAETRESAWHDVALNQAAKAYSNARAVSLGLT